MEAIGRVALAFRLHSVVAGLAILVVSIVEEWGVHLSIGYALLLAYALGPVAIYAYETRSRDVRAAAALIVATSAYVCAFAFLALANDADIRVAVLPVFAYAGLGLILPALAIARWLRRPSPEG